MSDINVQLVREFFELHLFHVLTYWQEGSPRLPEPMPRGGDAPLLLFVENTNHDHAQRPEFLLSSRSIGAIERAVVEVRAWHADRFYASVVEGNAVLGHVASAETRQLAEHVLGTREFSTILVISELPASAEPRDKALTLLRQLGVDHVLEFPALLSAMLEKVHAQGHYAPSATLQTLRLLKRYDLIRRHQLEFLFPFEPVAESPLPASADFDDVQEREDD